MIDHAKLRTRSIGFRIREADFGILQALAERQHKSLAEWCRDNLVELADRPAGKPVEQALLAEVIALRTIVANLIYAFTGEGKVTREQMLAFVDRADKTKLRRAMEFLSQILQNGESGISVEPPQGLE